MPLSPGDKLGPYEIVSELGAGGMGEVYRARDRKLNRDVAIKVLPAALAGDAQYMARFEREAQMLAAQNHPNIATVYGIEQGALVMELVEGADLKGPLPLEEAIAIARQIAAGLEAAHEKGIIHRDLKPANIKLTPAGVVKILDFGLAKSASESSAASGANATISPTLSLEMTRAGMILGTAAYMSPEQARGKVVDKRTDIWAFGVVLYEIVTGKRLFEGEDLTETLASVVKDKPDLSAVPANVRRLLERCLEKDPKKRLRDIGDMELLLAEASAPAPLPAGSRSSRVPWIAAGSFALAFMLAGVGWYNATRPAPLRPLIRLNAEISPDTPLARVHVVGGNGGNMLALSPDGARLALTLRGADGKVRLNTLLLNQGQVAPLAGTENAYDPFFSPAGDWVGFFAEGKLKKISVEGGAAVTLCDAPSGVGASWGDDGNIIAALNFNGVLTRVPSGGGTPVPLTKLNPGEVTHRWPQVLPESQAVLFTSAAQVAADYSGANIDVISLKTGERKTIQRGGFSARYLPTSTGTGTGHLIYVHETTLFAAPFDPVRLATGAGAPILEDVGSTLPGGGDFAFAGVPSGPGTFVYLSGKGQAVGWSISWVDSSGKTQPLHAPPGRYYTPRFSPDGKRLAFSMGNAKGEDIWVKDLDRDTPSRLSFLPGQNRWPVWTPDGKNIVFQSTDPAAQGLYWVRSDGSGEAQRLTEGKPQGTPSPYSFSPDGMRLAFQQIGNGGGPDIFTAPVEGDPGRGALGVRLGKVAPFLGTPFHRSSPAFSPDGRWLAYVSNESGKPDVYVRPFPGPGGRWQVSTGGGLFPLWSRDGRDLLFQTLDSRVMAASYTAKGDSFAAGKPRVWTKVPLRNLAFISNYDLAPDGKRLAAFLPDDAGGEKAPTHLTFLLNFFDELRRKAPTGK